MKLIVQVAKEQQRKTTSDYYLYLLLKSKKVPVTYTGDEQL